MQLWGKGDGNAARQDHGAIEEDRSEYAVMGKRGWVFSTDMARPPLHNASSRVDTKEENVVSR